VWRPDFEPTIETEEDATSFRHGVETPAMPVNNPGITDDAKCLASRTDDEDKRHSVARDRVRRVKNRQGGAMALWWTAAAFDAASKEFHRSLFYNYFYINNFMCPYAMSRLSTRPRPVRLEPSRGCEFLSTNFETPRRSPPRPRPAISRFALER
jgi:hypothetical protein